MKMSLRSGIAVLALWGAAVTGAAAGEITLDFTTPIGGTIQDSAGQGTGLTDRLAGTGGSLGAQDTNLVLNTTNGVLEVTSTASDINNQLNMSIGEYLGVNLSSLGFTGSEDFAVSAVFQDIQYSEIFDQFGLYVGVDSDTNFRAGYLYFFPGFNEQLFSVHNTSGLDSNLTLGAGPAPGSTLSMSITRQGGIFSMLFNNVSFSIIQPAFLNGFTDLNVGLFAANARNDSSKRATVSSFSARVDTIAVPEPSTLALLGLGLAGLGLARRRKLN